MIMSAPTLLPPRWPVTLDYVTCTPDRILLVVTTTQPDPRCPECGHPAQRVHSRYERTVADLPWQGLAVHLRLRSRRFFCDQRDCERAIFTERLPGLVTRYGRRTLRLAEMVQLLGVALGGEGGARLAERLGMAVSADALLQRLRQGARAAGTPRVLGVDDFAFRKGQRYGTILIDLEAGKPIDLLPDRQAETLADWLKERPGVQIVARDRSWEYARGIRDGAPEAIQVTDRFHLLSNLREMLERVIERNRSLLQGIGLPTVALEVGEAPPEREVVSRFRRPAKRSPTESSIRQARYQHRLTLRQQVHTLREQGESILGIAQRLDLNRSTVYRYLRSQPESGAVRTRQVGSMLDPFPPYLYRRWSEGCRNGSQLWRELRERGYRGSRKMVAVWTQQQREAPAPTAPKKHRAASEAAPVQATGPASAASSRLPCARRMSWFLWRDADALSPTEQATLTAVHAAAPELATIQPLVHEFQRLVNDRDATAFTCWRERALRSSLPELCSFVAGLDRDLTAVVAGLTLPWSNGPVEGQVNRLKVIKRQMYGRAKFDLLRARVLVS